jgi:membrane protein DedA with SNARE-associated domain
VDSITGIEIIDSLINWALSILDQWGYVLVFGFTIFENLFVIGSFTPGETIVMAAAFLSTPGQGSLNIVGVWVASFLGTFVGTNITYFMGRWGGRDLLLRMGRRFKLDEKRLAAGEEYFFRHGSKTVFLSRMAPGFKNMVPMIAGVSKMHLGYFEGWTVAGAALYTTLYCAIGYFIGENFDYALQIAANLGWIGFVIFVVVIGGVWYFTRRAERRRIDRLAGERQEVMEALHELDERGPDPWTDEPCEKDLRSDDA